MFPAETLFWYNSGKYRMEFRKRHKKLYLFWMISSLIVAVSMVAFLLAPIFYSR